MTPPLDFLRAPIFRRAASGIIALTLAAVATRAVAGSEVRARLGNPLAPPPAARAELVNIPVVSRGNVVSARALDFDSLVGRSGQLRMRLLEPSEVEDYPFLIERFGDVARAPGVRAVDFGGAGGSAFSFITLTPWGKKLGSYINGYHLGMWPSERRAMPTNYDNPAGFIEVTPANLTTKLSAHFALRDFVTHDQASVWPKYVVLREELLDKLELVLGSLQSMGVATQHVVVLSGFRSPQYNSRGAGEGMAQASRHQFGDGADIIIDADRDGRMDDLNHDGRVDFQDTQVIDRAVGLVERKYPELVGGLGLYQATGPSGPFAHIDVRGTRARWTNAGRRSARHAGAFQRAESAPVQASGRCRAEGAMAVLCAGVR